HDSTIEMLLPVLLCLTSPMPLLSATAKDGNRIWTASSHYPVGSQCPACSWPTRVLVEKMMNNSREDVMSLSTQGNYINLQAKPSSGWTCC
ncbi:RAB7, member RAS oncogene family-like 1, isoform CRA_c, partial [Mus musculus]